MTRWVSSGIIVVLAAVLSSCTTVVKVPVTATSTSHSTTVTTGTALEVTVVAHIPDESGPEPPPVVAPNTPCSFALSDDNVTVYGPDDSVLASASFPMGNLLFPGNTGFTSPYQCTSEVKVSLPYQADYTFTMSDGWNTPKLSVNYLETDGGIAPIDDPNGIPG